MMAENPQQQITPTDNARPGFWHGVVQLYRVAALLMLNTLIILAVVEVGASIALPLIDQTPEEAPLAEQVETFKQKQLSLSYYRDQDWSRAYWDEHMLVVDHWDYQPYIIWRTRPASGDYINVDEHGTRQTPGSICTEESYRIFMFGGSTMWGFGAPDWGTIPAYLQAGLTEQGRDVCVINAADVAFNSTQSVIKLLLELQAGNVPDMVIFYDGANDVTIANVTGEAGAHFYLDEIETAVQGNLAFGSPDEEAQQPSPWRDLLTQTASYRLVQAVIDSTMPEVPGPPLAPPSQEFVDSVVDIYLTNISTVDLLAEAYGFDFIAFWQPVLEMSDGDVTDEEQRFLWEMPGGLPELFRTVYAQVETEADSRAYLENLTHVLDEREGSLWIDFNHLSPLGNEIVAEAMLDGVLAHVGD